MKCRADPAQAPGLGGGGWCGSVSRSTAWEGAQLQCSHFTHTFLFNGINPPQALSPLPLSHSYGPHKQRSPFTPPRVPTNKFSPTPPTLHSHVHRHPPTPPRVPTGISPPLLHVPNPRHSPLHPHVPPRSPPGTPMLFRDPPSPHTPHAPRCPLCPPSRSAPRTAPRPVSREEPPPRYSAVTWRGGCWGCRRRPYIARSGRAARVAGAAGGAAAAVSIPPTSHPSPLPGRGS